MTALPQLFKLWRSKDTTGVALGTYGVWVSTAAWWALWSAEVGAWPSFYMNMVCLLLDIAVVAFLRPSLKVWFLVAAGPALGLLFINNTTILLCVAMALQLYVALPTLALVLKNRPVSGLSAGTWAAVLSSNILWIAYMMSIGQPQSTVVDFVAGVCAVVILVRIGKARKWLSSTAPSSSLISPTREHAV